MVFLINLEGREGGRPSVSRPCALAYLSSRLTGNRATPSHGSIVFLLQSHPPFIIPVQLIYVQEVLPPSASLSFVSINFFILSSSFFLYLCMKIRVAGGSVTNLGE